jgi:hypothetical protein
MSDAVGAYTRIDRAERLLGWRPRYDVADGIAHSLQWAAIRDQILPARPYPLTPPVSPPGNPGRRLGSLPRIGLEQTHPYAELSPSRDFQVFSHCAKANEPKDLWCSGNAMIANFEAVRIG